MKKFDRYSIRGIICIALGVIGMGYEVFFSMVKEVFLIVMYSIVIGIGVLLLFVVRNKKS
jgi:hypothetical protein